jgi:[protein-PII] uridylyltransferase
MSFEVPAERDSPVERKLRKGRDRLINGFLKKEMPDFLDRHARIIDDYFFQCFEASQVGPELGIFKNPFAIIALGGYGRKEQCIHSDVDLLFLFKKKIPKRADALIREMVYPLWDVGLDVGYAIRSMKECLGLAAQDYEVLTSLLDARIVCGVSQLNVEMKSALVDNLFPRKGNHILSWLVERNRERHQRFGDSSYLLEPNLKEGHGGLRDYHTMLWIARIRSNLKEQRDLEYDGFLSHDEYRTLSEAVSFIWYVRNHLHHIANRRCDQLYFEYQEKLADVLGYKAVNGFQPVERFLGVLHGHMESVKQIHEMFIYELGLSRKIRRDPKKMKVSKVKGLKIDRGEIYFNSPGSIPKNPDLLVEIFRESVRLKTPLSADAKRLIKEFLYLADKPFVGSAAVVKAFEKVLVSRMPRFNALEEMLSTGFLTKFIPEINTIVNRIQYDDYHLYPVDRHSMRTVETIKSFGTSSDLLSATLYIELRRKKLLLWAALLHDIGKGQPGRGHSVVGARIVEKILGEKGFKPADVETVSFLVRYHLYLIQMATRRDIQDEETAVACAREIKDIDRLKMLYLLSVADSQSTGPKAWNDWTATLLRDLFLKVLTTLEKGELASRESVKLVEEKKAAVLDAGLTDADRKASESLFNVMSPRYLLYAKPAEIVEHTRLYHQLGAGEFIWDIVRTHESDTRQVTICAKDRPGLLSKVAGVLTLNGLDILDVQVYTWRNNIALDIFKVVPPMDQIFESEKWSRAEATLRSALADTLDLGSELVKRVAAYKAKKNIVFDRDPEIVIDNEVSSFYTIIEVYAYDFPGLLFLITDALFRCRLDVWVAKIGTRVDQVVDVFYVRDFDGQKVDSSDRVSEIESSIMAVLEGKI